MTGQYPSMSVYRLDFKGLSVGEHQFKLPITGDLFALYEGCEIFGGEGECSIELIKSETMLQLEVEIVGQVEVECDRCLAPCKVEVDYEDTLFVKFTDNEELANNEYDGEVMWITAAQSELDLTHYIYESIILSLPHQRAHQDIEECDPAVVGFLAQGVELEEREGLESEGLEESEDEELSALPEEQIAKLKALREKMFKE